MTYDKINNDNNNRFSFDSLFSNAFLKTLFVFGSVLFALSFGLMTFVNAHGEFGLSLSVAFSELSDPENNFVFSPFSVITALDMVYSGSAGFTAKEIASLFGYSESPQELAQQYARYHAELEKLLSSVVFRTAQGLLISDKDFVSDQYVELMKKSFSSEVFYGNTENAVTLVNNWVSNKTNHKITQLLSSVPDDLAMIVLNAIYFRGDWNEKFNEQMTRPKKFTLLSGRVIQVPMMSKQFNKTNVFEGKTRRMFLLPYDGNEIALLIALPNNKMKETEDRATVVADFSQGLKQLFSLGDCIVQVELPKFKIEHTVNFVDIFKHLGLSALFDRSTCDLTPMSGRKPGDLFVSGIVQKAVLEVNEKGSEGAAATAVVFRAKSKAKKPTPKIIEFIVDRPFEFYIVTRKTQDILFSGRVMNPL